MMTRRVISLIREAGGQDGARHTHRDLPGRHRGAQLPPCNGQRVDGGLLNVTSQVAWQRDINIGPRLPPVEYRRHHDDDRGRASKSWQFPPRRSHRVQPLDADVTDDVDGRERRRHRRAHRKHRRHRREQHQALVSGGHWSA